MIARMLTPAEVAEFLRIDEDDVLGMVADRELVAFGVDDEVLIPQGELNQFVHGAWTGEPWAS